MININISYNTKTIGLACNLKVGAPVMISRMSNDNLNTDIVDFFPVTAHVTEDKYMVISFNKACPLSSSYRFILLVRSDFKYNSSGDII